MKPRLYRYRHTWQFLVTCILFCLCGNCLWAATVENGNMAFSMVINKPKDPFCSVVVRDAAGTSAINKAHISANATLTDIFATVFVDTNISSTYQIRFICSPFEMALPGGSTAYLYYDLTIYDDTAPVAGAPFTVGLGGYTSDYLVTRDKAGKAEESLEFAKLAIRLRDVQSALAGDAYQADIAVEVRTV
ncbi:MAG: hypothetical protein SPD11_05650 [Sphaerochaetaceae bacterium]|nr:hypothetical protein [Sphaerochaetaceae bacterium]